MSKQKANRLLQIQKEEIHAQRENAESAYDQLKSAQAQLIQSEKMASLGELTAGIAHEIKNPLNFVNNFSDICRELIDEMKVELAEGNQKAAIEIADDIKQNLGKINQHGKRADSIVQGMLEHSKRGSGQKQETDVNALADEFLRMTYQSFLAKNKEFKAEFSPIAISTNLDPGLPMVSVIPQDIGKALLNLYGNAFYACNERLKLSQTSVSQSSGHDRSKSSPSSEDVREIYLPSVLVSTKKEGNTVLITVKDNGIGIPSSIKEKIFQPFFTTKPTGQGTGLGLSLSYDIVKSHGGELKVKSEEGKGTEFIILLPINPS